MARNLNNQLQNYSDLMLITVSCVKRLNFFLTFSSGPDIKSKLMSIPSFVMVRVLLTFLVFASTHPRLMIGRALQFWLFPQYYNKFLEKVSKKYH